MKSCLAHTDTTCGEGAYQDPREDSPNPTHRCLRLGSTPKSHHISDAPSSEESTDKDKPSKVPPPNCSQWGPRLQHHMRVWQGKGTASCSKCRRTRVCSPRTHSLQHSASFHPGEKKEISIFYRKFSYLSVPKVSIAVNWSKLLAKCSHTRLSQRSHLADTLTTFSSQSAVVCQNSPRLINMDNATSHSVC